MEKNKTMFKAAFINDERDLIFGYAPRPIICGKGVEIGNGSVIPEINFTLPQMAITEESWKEVKSQYDEMTRGICQRAVDLVAPALVVEFELLPPMTFKPEWGAEITAILRHMLDEFYEKYGLRSALRVTPVDLRDNERPPRRRSGELMEKTFRSFELCGEAGADLFSIESTGGKELHDEALLRADLPAIIFALGVLAVNDMELIWSKIIKIAAQKNTIPAGDTACGFANTAMTLAEKRLIPRTLAAVIRVAAVVRSMVAYWQGAKGPSKDCAYEGPYIKALCGVPISMEGKSSACAHFSPLGNISAACCDLWSNESVQNVRLLSGPAPVVSLEQLIYDCRLMNQGLKESKSAALKLRDWLVESDAPLDPQAYVLKPDVVVKICQEMIKAASPLDMTFCAITETLSILREAFKARKLKLHEQERHWLDLLSFQLDSIPQKADSLWALVKTNYSEDKIIPQEYLLV